MTKQENPLANNQELDALRSRYNLSRVEIQVLTRSANTTTVDGWLMPPDSVHVRRMPDRAMRLLKLELGLEKPAFTHLVERAAALKAGLKRQVGT
jgi:hypothetical protein